MRFIKRILYEQKIQRKLQVDEENFLKNKYFGSKVACFVFLKSSIKSDENLVRRVFLL